MASAVKSDSARRARPDRERPFAITLWSRPLAVQLRYVIQTFGCQMNAHDSDRMGGVLRAAGGVAVDRLEDADLIVFNTCSVREKAEQKLRSEVGKLAPLKRERPDVVIAVAGCVAQQEGEALLDRIRHVDLVIGPDNIEELPALVMEQMAGAPPAVRTEFDTAAPRFLTRALPPAVSGLPGARVPVTGFVTTMKGCDERCSFCVVPYTRGPERYRPAREIADEVLRLAEAGSREILLLGQTVDSFRAASLPAPDEDDAGAGPSQDGDATQFPHLLRLIDREAEGSGLLRLRYTSPHPRHATASLARAHAELGVLARHVHLPVQSGSNRILRRMIRRYTRAEYVFRAERLMRSRAGLTLSTDIIVGFPGETEEDFAETLSLVREIGFVSLYGFKYSPRPHTPALRLTDDVAEDVKSERLARLFETAEEIGGAHLRSLVGTKQTVLVEGASKSEKGDLSRGRVQGRTDRSEIVHIAAPGAASLVGRAVEVEVTRANRHSLAGELTGPLPAVPPTPVVRPSTRRLPVW
ncbi:MAG: tRNA (N6-isopentenyl adenosine(37)-C2)-methylthiotransferase MiaB [Polyangiaceae bacterium]